MPASLARLAAPCPCRRVRGRDGDAVDLLGDEVVDDLHLLLAAAMLAGADIQAFDRAVRVPSRPSCSRRAPGRRTGCSCSSAPGRTRISWAAAWAPWRHARGCAAAATVALNSFPIMAFPPFAGDSPPGLGNGASAQSARLPRIRSKQNRENDESADEGALPIGIDAGHQQAVADDLDQRGADEGAEGAAFAAHQVGAADHRGGDDAQLIALCPAH